MEKDMGKEGSGAKTALKRTLILSIDRDADVKVKAGVETPIIGRERILEAASKLLVADPEEADGNTLFASINLLDRLREEGGEVDVAAICGREGGGLKADREMVKELEEVLSRFPVDEAILVTDGYADSEVLPIVSSHIKIASVRHVVVKHSRSVEETYALWARYLRMLWSEAPYRLYLIGVPGLIILLLGILTALGLMDQGIRIALVILGAAMVVKGFGVDDYISSLRRAPAVNLLKAVSFVAAVVSVIAGLYLSYVDISRLGQFHMVLTDISLFWTYGALLVGRFLKNFLPAFLIGGFIYISGILLHNIVVEEGPILRYTILAVSMVILYFVGNEAAMILIDPQRGMSLLIFYIAMGIGVLFLVTTAAYFILRMRE